MWTKFQFKYRTYNNTTSCEGAKIYKRNELVSFFSRVKYGFGPYKYTTFRFSHSKIFHQLLVPIEISITTVGPYFKLILVFLMKLCRNV